MTTTQTTLAEQMHQCADRTERKQLLKALSNEAKQIIELNGLDKRVNEVLVQMMTDGTHKEFNNFWEWKKQGYKVKKGAKAFFIWSKKREATKQTESGEDEEFKFFSLAYLFSNAQVEPLTKKANA
ncbi:hypothetical protein ACFFVB_18465 [Formosa undariae]|uniref:N-terminal domain-containing protein n=1 Tax=Formosa undariae TaxID=1325436 RepID=A0ABV5F6J5_9FLAO